MDQLVLVFVVLLAAILAEPLSRRIGVSSAVLMTLFGGVLALIPMVPNVEIPPDLILPLVLPPLLYAAARRTSWRAFQADWPAITGRAVGLVILTAAAVAVAFHATQPALPIAAAVVVGALVAPPDPIAATAMAGRLGLPRRLVSVLEGEGLFNDVTAVVIYSVAVHALVSGDFSTGEALVEFAMSALIAVAVGLALGWGTSRLMNRLDETVWKVSLSLLMPFAAYGLADAWSGSAVLAVLVCALYLTDAANSDDSAYRIVSDSFWEIIELLVSGFAFALIGLELAAVLLTIGSDWARPVGSAAVVVAVVVLLRLAWLLGWWALNRARPGSDEPYTWQEAIVTGWTGMRGVVTVALALALPLTVAAGRPLPGRSEIVITAFAVVLFTLLVQGTTLPAVVRLTGVQADTRAERVIERQIWIRVMKAEVARLKEVAQARGLPDEIYERLRSGIQRRLAASDPEAAGDDARAASRETSQRELELREILGEAVAAGREAALAMRHEPGMPPDIVDRVMRRLDLISAPGGGAGHAKKID